MHSRQDEPRLIHETVRGLLRWGPVCEHDLEPRPSRRPVLLLKPPTIGELGWKDGEVEWLEQTVRHYVAAMTREQRSELGITPELARQILKKGTVRRALPATCC